MTKKEFLKELEKKLNILEATEKQDIINEYSDILDEKVRNGKKVKEAIDDFGDIDELASEILKAYKINPDYEQEESGKISDDFERIVKKSASKMANFTTKAIEEIKKENNNITVEIIFEMVIKLLVILVLCAILKFPFWILEGLGVSLLDVFFSPLNQIFIFFWRIIVWLIYIIFCVLIGIIIMKDYFNYFEKDVSKETIKDKGESDNKYKDSNLVKNNQKDYVYSNKKTNYLFSIGKLLIFIFLVLPFLLINIGVGLSVAFVIYLIVLGLDLIGLLILLIGLMILFGAIYNMFYGIVINKPKTHLPLYITGMVFIMIGAPIFAYNVGNMEYVSEFPLNISSRETVVYKEKIYEKTHFKNIGNKQEIIIDNNLKNNEVIIEANHYNKVTSVRETKTKKDSENYIEFYTINKNFNFNQVFNQIIIKDLKNNKIHDYRKLYNVDLKIYTNEYTRQLIKN